MSSNAEVKFKRVIPSLKKLTKFKKKGQLCKVVIGPSELQNSWTAKQSIINDCDCCAVLEAIAWIWRFFAIFPFTMQGPFAIMKYRLNKFWALYSIFICFGSIANFVYSLLIFKTQFRDDVSIAPITICMRTIASLLSLIVSSILRIFRHKRLSESIGTMSEQEIILEKLNCRLIYGTSAKMICAYVWTSVMMVISLMVYDYYASIQVFGRIEIHHWLFWTIPILAQVINLTIFGSLVGLLGLQFRTVNEKIRTIAVRANASSAKVIVTSNAFAENLRLVAKVHYNICAIGKRINSLFDWDVIINVITAFVILTTTLYFIFVEVQRENDADYIRIGTYIHWELIHSIPLIVVVAICNWTYQQASYAGKFIHEIRARKTDSELYEAVKSFSLQLHHQKLEFTAGGFFPLNSTLLQTMVGNITTYLVILIQFQPKLD